MRSGYGVSPPLGFGFAILLDNAIKLNKAAI